MKKDFIHIVQTGFARGITQTDDWWKHRLKIFKNYTFRSLMNQTNRDFYLLVIVDNKFPLVNELKETISKKTSKFIIVNKDIEDAEERIKKFIIDFEKFEYVYLTRIDSDDLFHKDIIEEIQQYPFSWRRALIMQKGYCYNCVDDKLQYYTVNSPPNSTIMFPRDIYIDVEKRKEYIGPLHGHDQVFGKFNSIVLSKYKYMILVHGKNRRTIYHENAIELERFEIEKEKHNEILIDFGIYKN